MNASLRFAVLLLSVTALGGCASMDERSTSVGKSHSGKSSQLVEFQQDNAYVAYVEKVARRRGIHLQWVNPPTKRVEADKQ